MILASAQVGAERELKKNGKKLTGAILASTDIGMRFFKYIILCLFVGFVANAQSTSYWTPVLVTNSSPIPITGMVVTTSSPPPNQNVTVINSSPIPTDGSSVTQPVSGTFWQATQPVSGAFWQSTQPISGVMSSISNASSTTLLVAANSMRNGLILHNDSNQTCKIAFAATASATAFTFRLPSQSEYFMAPPIYSGAVSEICDTSNGSERITEY